MGPIGKLLALSPDERLLIVKATLLIVPAGIAVSILPFKTVRRVATWLGRPRDTAALRSRPAAEKISWAVAAAGNRIPGGRNCLVKAVAGEVMLGRFGYQSQLKIGAGRGPSGEFVAHAWLESEGKILIGQFDLDRYTELAGPGSESPVSVVPAGRSR